MQQLKKTSDKKWWKRDYDKCDYEFFELIKLFKTKNLRKENETVS